MTPTLRSLLAASREETAPDWRADGMLVLDGIGQPICETEDSLADAALIVAAVNAIPGLLDRIERLEEALRALLVPVEEEWADGVVDNYRRRAGEFCMRQARAALEQP